MWRKAYRLFHDLSLLKKLWLSFSFVTLLMLAVFAWLSSTSIQKMITEREAGIMLQNIGSYTGSIDSYIQSVEKSSQMIVYNPKIQEHLKGNVSLLSGEERIRAYSDINEQMHLLLDHLYRVEAVYLVDRYQKVFNANISMTLSPDYLISDEFRLLSIYERTLQTKESSFWSFVQWSPSQRSMVMFKAIYSKTDLSLLGYLVVSISPTIFDTYLSASKLGDGDSGILDQGGFVYSAGNPDGVIGTVDPSQFVGTNGYFMQKYDSDAYIVAYSRYELTNWVFVHAVKQDVMMRGVKVVNSLFLLLLLASLVVMLIVFAFISRTISMPLRKMMKLLREVERGNLNARFQAMYKDEFGMLGHAFNKMLDKVREGIPIIREKFIRSLLEGSMNETEWLEYERRLDFRFDRTRFQVVLLHLHDSESEQERAAAEMLLQDIENRCKMISGTLTANQICLIFNCPEETMLEELRLLMVKMKGRYGMRTSAYVGNGYEDVHFVKTSFEEAKALVKYGVSEPVAEEPAILFCRDSWHNKYPDSYETRLFYYMEEGDYENCAQIMDEFIEYARSNNIAPPILNTFLTSLYQHLHKLAIKFGHPSDWMDKEGLTRLYRDISLEPLETNARVFLRLLGEYLTASVPKRKKQSANVTKSLSLIEEEFRNPDLGVDYVARALGLNTNYFSQLFKKEVGIGFAEFVSGLRIEHAKRLLGQPGVKIKDVACKVGVSDPHYFGVWFKDNTGLSPSQFRKQVGGM